VKKNKMERRIRYSRNNPYGRPRNKEWVIGGDEYNIEAVVESYYHNNQSLHTPVNSEDVQKVTSLTKYPTFNETLHLKDPSLKLGWNLRTQHNLEPLLDIMGVRMNMTTNFLKMKVTEH